MKKPKSTPGTHRALWEQDSPFRYPRVEQVRDQDRKQRKYRRRAHDYLDDEPDEYWSD
jgi:hypothetical protein